MSGQKIAEIRLSIPMDEASAKGAARVGDIVTAFVEDHHASLHVGGFVSGPIIDRDNQRVGRFEIRVPLS